MWFIREWKYAVILCGALAAIIFLGLWRLEVAETKNLQAKIDTLQDTVLEREAEVKQCNDDKAITEGVSSDYQKSIASMRRQLNELKRVREAAKCLPLIPRTSQ